MFIRLSLSNLSHHAQLHSLYAVSSLSLGLCLRLLTRYLHLARFPHRHALTLYPCLPTRLARGEDLDPTGGWILALLRTSP